MQKVSGDRIREALAQLVFFSKYARYNPELKRRETYEEAIERMLAMHVTFYGDVIKADLPFVRQALLERMILPSGRAMQFAGPAILKKHTRIFNCSFSHCDRPRFFAEAMWLLLCGCGTGFSVQRQHVAKLPGLVRPGGEPQTHVVADSIEGWADAADALIRSYLTGFHGPEESWIQPPVRFDYSQVRPEGSPLSSSSGKAPGPKPLRDALEAVRGLLDALEGTRLRPIDCYDIVMHLSGAVLAGGVRRSATICLFSADDEEMMNAKTSDWFTTNPQRSRSNNSAVLLRGHTPRETFDNLIKSTKEMGEPGFLFVDDLEQGTNPCVRAGTRILTRTGYARIESLVGKETTIWNGDKWVSVKPFSTGVNELLRVSFDDGTSLDVTPYHKFLTCGGWQNPGEQRVEAQDLRPGDKLAKYDMPIVEDGVDPRGDAYSQGFYSADGCTDHTSSKLYFTKQMLRGRLVGTHSEVDAAGNSRWLHGHLLPKNFVPTNASLKYRLEWLAGLLDGDGTVTRDKNRHGLQLVSIDPSFLKELRLLLTTLGVRAKIVHAMDAGMRELPDGRGAKKEYFCKETQRILIGNSDTAKLLQLGLNTSRLELSKEAVPQRDARRFVQVKEVVDLGVSEETFCFTDEVDHRGTFEGIVTGNCGEISLYPTIDGESSWSFCNLTSISFAACNSQTKAFAAARAAAILGTWQAGYTEPGYLGETSRRINERDALLGVSLTGMADAPHLAFNEQLQVQMANIVKQANMETAAKLGIRAAARTTCVKPEGTQSLVVKAGNGIHPHHDEDYIRHVQFNVNEEPVKHFLKSNPHAVFKSPYREGDVVVAFPVSVSEGAWIKKQTTALGHLQMVLDTQKAWVETGTNRGKSHHNVSNTILVREDEWEGVADFLWHHQTHFAGVSLLPASGDLDYQLAPFVALRDLDGRVRPVQQQKFEDLLDAWQDVDYTQMHEEEDVTKPLDLVACGGGSCSI